ncbi:unnamed protein product [Ceratitis capitata]|uniref:(Mediterranean fruit fly) hypothetical protein n=1 Tax=Ceratitis capitata TaxID=7213 RepID=A0A811U544_CERCA|nr:unnamed protein product [Ceratitis capitata]
MFVFEVGCRAKSKGNYSKDDMMKSSEDESETVRLSNFLAERGLISGICDEEKKAQAVTVLKKVMIPPWEPTFLISNRLTSYSTLLMLQLQPISCQPPLDANLRYQRAATAADIGRGGTNTQCKNCCLCCCGHF